MKRYHYPNERSWTVMDTDMPIVPPSRRKLRETNAERAEKPPSRTKLGVGEILARAARGKLYVEHGSYGPMKPPPKLWPSGSQLERKRK